MVYKNCGILLDLGGVVFQSRGISNNYINWDIISELNHKYAYDLNIGKDLFPVFVKEYNEKTKLNLTGSEFLKFIFDTLEFNQELIDAIRNVADIIIVSDNYRENMEYISERYHFQDWAVHQIYSYDYQMVKAHPLFFKKVLKEISPFQYEHILFIDDSPHKLESAARQGIPSLLFEGNDAVIPFIIDFFRFAEN